MSWSYEGGCLTSKGSLGNQRMSRLDRFLFTDDCDCYFGGAIQSLLPRPISNHVPILLGGGDS